MATEVKEVTEFGDRPVNTRRLQMFELNHFMLSELNAIFDGVCFTDIEFGTQYSFEQAVVRFNDREDKGDDGYLLDRVKLRYCKKSKAIICTNHWVKAVEDFKQMCEDDNVPVFQALYSAMKRLRLR